jgi:hypothetical protein
MFRLSCKVIFLSQVHHEGNNSISSFCFISLSFQVVSRSPFKLKALLGQLISFKFSSFVGGLEFSLVIGQKTEVGPNPFTPRGRADLVVWIFKIKNAYHDTARAC